ncbi:nuclear transcription factor Y subunit A-10-like [Mangifera indica]|uniref:nuclear transcription factor Y subunit A-10-like n=1 Tax=Mangifera indica TaxID=29780 RepID=UPI001CFBC3FF|nr:nuclear transcription factor Y subunit A-10-like [Mangifera indica]XP_044489018.1 nuclear transcription factor Y subunit A-10-like [Mangifera indica]
MAMQTVYLKEHEGNVHNPTGQFSSVPPAPWWSQLGSQPVYACGQSKSFSIEIPTEEASQRLDKGNLTQFTLFPGDCKNSLDGHKLPGAVSLQSALPENHARFEIGFGQHMIRAKYPFADQYYGVFSAYGPQISGRIMLPLNLSSDDGPIYVNAKQYHGIIRRRKSRAKAVLENKITAKRKPYMHHSRHLHAMRRPRGCGGRFLNAKELKKNGRNEEKKDGELELSPRTGSQSSEVLQSDGGNLISSKETHCNTSNLSGSEVTSMFSRGDFDRIPFNHIRPSVQSFSGIMDIGRGIVMPSQWVATAGSCSNLKA